MHKTKVKILSVKSDFNAEFCLSPINCPSSPLSWPIIELIHGLNWDTSKKNDGFNTDVFPLIISRMPINTSFPPMLHINGPPKSP